MLKPTSMQKDQFSSITRNYSYALIYKTMETKDKETEFSAKLTMT